VAAEPEPLSMAQTKMPAEMVVLVVVVADQETA
jgi:hypothetical protein